MQEIAVVIALLAALCYGGWRIMVCRISHSQDALTDRNEAAKAVLWRKIADK